MAEVMIEYELTEILDESNFGETLGNMMAKGPLQMLYDEATRRGYRYESAQAEQGGQRTPTQLGLRQVSRAREQVQPDSDDRGSSVQETRFELYIRALEKPDSRDQAALINVSIQAGENTEEYNLLLEAPGGYFLDTREFMVENDRVVPAFSWWSAFKNCLTSRCGTSCLGALVACSGTTAGYVACVIAACAGCGVKCAACATCNCKWWCRWAPGCCRR